MNGQPELPAAFFTGYGQEVSRSLLLLYRVVSGSSHLGSNAWAPMATDRRVSQALRTMPYNSDKRLLEWILRLDDHLANL